MVAPVKKPIIITRFVIKILRDIAKVVYTKLLIFFKFITGIQNLTYKVFRLTKLSKVPNGNACRLLTAKLLHAEHNAYT